VVIVVGLAGVAVAAGEVVAVVAEGFTGFDKNDGVDTSNSPEGSR